MFTGEKRYANRMHPKKPIKWRTEKYWGKLNLDRDDRWVFGDKDTGQYLLKYSGFTIQRHPLVKGLSSPDDPDLREYWSKRNLEKSKILSPSHQKVAKKQGGKCPICGQSLFNNEELHLHHKKPRKDGGDNKYSNLQLVQLYCHQQIHAQDRRIKPED